MQFMYDVMYAIDPDHSLSPEFRSFALVVVVVLIVFAASGIPKTNETTRLAKQGQPSPHKHRGTGKTTTQTIVLIAFLAFVAWAYLNAKGGI